MATNKLQAEFISAIKGSTSHSPWNLLPKQTKYEESKHQHGFRKNQMPVTVKLYGPILKAVEMYLGTPQAEPAILIERPLMGVPVSGKTAPRERFLEVTLQDDSCLVMHKKLDSIRITHVETDGTEYPIQPFKNESETTLSALVLLCLPDVLEADKALSGKLWDTMEELEPFLADVPTWSTAADIPELAKDCAYFMDTIFEYLQNTAVLVFDDVSASSGTGVAQPVVDEIGKVLKTGAAISGSLICETNISGTAFRFVASNGKKAATRAKAITIGEAKDMFASFSAHRHWSAAEKMLIPQFPDDMPVMEETLRIANRIVSTRDDLNPVCNAMWRGVTSYGKSTGVKQLAAILNMPLLILTCHPNMEISEFKSTFVPESEGDGVELDMDGIAMPEDAEHPMSDNLRAAVDFISKMEKEDRKQFLSGSSFYLDAMMDAEYACNALCGKSLGLEAEEVCALYSETVSHFRELPLRLKLSQQESNEEPKEQKDNKPGFKHVLSNYVKALVNGYIIEIQEASRIRDSGVLVGINEYNRAGAVVNLMNGAMARRHKDAICIITDNVGYASCRPIDPSVLRRNSFIIDSTELSESLMKDRVRRNTGCKDSALIDRAYNLWKTVKDYCEQNSITEGSVSPTEFECFVQAVYHEGWDSMEVNLDDCIISKATSSVEDQRDIRTACRTLTF